MDHWKKTESLEVNSSDLYSIDFQQRYQEIQWERVVILTNGGIMGYPYAKK